MEVVYIRKYIVTGHAKSRHNQQKANGKTDRQNAYASQN